MQTQPTPPFSRPIVSLGQMAATSECCMAIDLFVESIVCGGSACRGMILCGPVGSAKRQAALAAAAEFGTHVVELEPTSLVSRDELLSILGKVGPDGVLVAHNFDELPAKAQADLALLVATGHATQRSNPYADDYRPGAAPEEPVPPRMLIATTNQLSSMPYAMAQVLPRFELRRSRDLIRWSLRRLLMAMDASCDPETIEDLATLIYLIRYDAFDKVAAVIRGFVGRCDGRRIERGDGSRIVGLCWSTVSTADLLEAMQAAAAEQGLGQPDLVAVASSLGVPGSLHEELRIHGDADSQKSVRTIFNRIAEKARQSDADDDD